MPQSEDGTRIEPLVSEPSASGTRPPATARARAAGGAAGHAARVVRVARGAVVDVLAGEVVGVLAHVERADQHGAGRLQPRDQRGVARGRRAVAVDLRAGERRQAGDVEQVLDRERHAGERPERAACARARIDRVGALARARSAVTAVNALSALVALGDARQRRLDHRERR